MDKYVCECCGGKINSRTMQCEYCGTQFERDNDVIRIERFTNPTRVYTAEICVGREMMLDGSREMGRIVIYRLADELSKAIAENMVIEHTFEPITRTDRVRGIIKMVHPVNI